ncbi:MAG: (2Fe-2S) ferredoxin domain-containing protein [Pseudanabaenaceae cyanobacterium SKYGB_i_bin29]|nr:(2Fe-2S) ferredoxin domain-containing protein [Pseudanabaenaceae cyanobacterium SKYG29]MDW8420519.1 (2Fe-2S) ferredoxin domain-containing protein [Pseudanabaenaceae cyanobacterium SKYGB_i_bin29]
MKAETTTVTYQGKFLGFTTLDGYKLKYFRLLTDKGEYIIKIPKEERLHYYKTLQVGDDVVTTVTECFDWKKGITKRKAIEIDKQQTTTADTEDRKTKVAIKVLVCQECKGSNQLIGELQRQLGTAVTIKPTGCMKRCKTGPNATVMPLKQSFTNVQDVTPIVNLINESLQ